jgi:predicted MFS family arabinose efflux permease
MFQKEYPAVVALASIMAVRMLGLFMILPVFSMHAGDFLGATPQLIGLALGIYGLTQAVLQMPFGVLSDRYGRKPVMMLGLGFFIAGSVYAALAHSIYGLIIGRALQGGGAIGSTVLAMVADITREENRSKAMAIIGLAISGAFALAMIAGPLIDAWAGLAGIFWVTAGLAIIAELLVSLVVPTPPVVLPEKGKMQAGLLHALTDVNLLRLDAGILILHAILTAFFIAIPFLLAHVAHLSSTEQAGLYLLVLVLAFAFILPPIIIGEKKRLLKPIFLIAISVLFISQVLLWPFYYHLRIVVVLLFVFFTMFSLLEAVLPSWISKVTPLPHKGAVMGCYSTAQFLGIFIGGSVGGWMHAHFGFAGVFLFSSGLALFWFVIALRLTPPPYLTTVIFDLHQFSEKNRDTLTQRLYGIAGVVEVAIITAEQLIYLKIDQAILSKRQLRQSMEKSKLIGVILPKEECRLEVDYSLANSETEKIF